MIEPNDAEKWELIVDMDTDSEEFITITEKWSDHPEGYDGMCMCDECKRYGV